MYLNRQSIRSLIGFGLFMLLFVVMKLVGVITWPWIWVLSPLWCALLLGALILLALGVVSLVKKVKK